MPFLDDVAKRLADSGVGVLNTNILLSSKSVVPAGPGPYLSLTETGGYAPIRRQNDGSKPAYRRPGVQLRARAASYPAARDMLQKAYDSLIGVSNTTINGTKYLSFTPKQDLTDMGLDDTGRPNIVVNFDALYATPGV